MKLSKELVAASATPVVLSILARGESYGYEIIQQVKLVSGGEVMWTDGMLYPVLHRLERQGLVKSRWGTSETGRKRKYYRLQKAGNAALERERAQWLTVHRLLETMWENPSCSRSMRPSPVGGRA